MRFLLLFIALLSLNLPAFAGEKATQSIVYEERFVWALAEKFSDELLQYQNKIGVVFSEGERGEMGMQYTILYHNYLVKCDGPLPELAIFVDNNKLTPPAEPEKISAFYLSMLNKNAWSFLEKWRSQTLVALLATLASGQYSFFPKCIVPGFLAQNELPGVNSK